MKKLLVIFMLCALGQMASACIHAPRGEQHRRYAVTEKTKQALLFHDGENAHLVIKTSLEAASQSEGTMSLPPFMAWVIPLPSLPSKYEEADSQLFKQLYEATEPQKGFGCVGRSEEEAMPVTGGINSAPAIKVHATELVGDYEITPVEMLTHDAGDALNEWLVKNGFGKVPKENQAFYVSKGVVFLALKIKKLSGVFADLKPLHIVYKSDKAMLPLKFSTHSGTFDVMLWTFTGQPLPQGEFQDYYLKSQGITKHVKRGQVWALDKISAGSSGYLQRFQGYSINASYRPVKNFNADPSLADSLAVQRSGLFDYAAYLLPLLAAAPFLFMWRRFRKPKGNTL